MPRRLGLVHGAFPSAPRVPAPPQRPGNAARSSQPAAGAKRRGQGRARSPQPRSAPRGDLCTAGAAAAFAQLQVRASGVCCWQGPALRLGVGSNHSLPGVSRVFHPQSCLLVFTNLCSYRC